MIFKSAGVDFDDEKNSEKRIPERSKLISTPNPHP
jgi:hypothetical protein